MAIALLLLCNLSCIERKPERLEKKESPVSAKLAAMVAELEALSQDTALAAEQLAAVRQRHCREVYRLMAQALIREPANLYHAALVLQQANESAGRDILLQAHYLAVEAAQKGYEPAKYLAAASLDRFLVLGGHRQLYGTQRYTSSEGVCQLYPYEPTTTDSARSAWNVPSLDSLLAGAEALNSR